MAGINIIGIDRIYYLRWQNIDRLTPLEFTAVKPEPLYYIIRANYGVFETWLQLALALYNYFAFYVCVFVSVLESHRVVKFQVWLMQSKYF